METKAGERESPRRQPIDELLSELQKATRESNGFLANRAAAQRAHDLVKEIRRRVAQDRQGAEDAVNTLVRLQIAQGLATTFRVRRQPYKDNIDIAALMDCGLLNHATFIQKPPTMLAFYEQLLSSMVASPRSVLEIGVKGGGSTALWKALFPDATVVGLDVKLRPALQSEPSSDGVIYIQGDQTDVTRLGEIANQYGPFDLVIDDGSHVTEHQATTMRSLLPRIRAGGFYVVEDIHASVKETSTREVAYGEDIWVDFTVTLLQKLRAGPFQRESAGARLALDLAPRVEQLVIARQILAICVRDREQRAVPDKAS